MTKNTTTDLGKKIRTIREEQGLTVEEVAKKLLLSKQKIIAIENNDYIHCPSVSYARGYVRAYAKLLGTDEQDMLQELSALNLSMPTINLDKSIVTSTKESNKTKHRKYIIWGGCIALLALIVLTMFSWPNRNITSGPNTITSPPQQVITPALNQQQ